MFNQPLDDPLASPEEARAQFYCLLNHPWYKTMVAYIWPQAENAACRGDLDFLYSILVGRVRNELIAPLITALADRRPGLAAGLRPWFAKMALHKRDTILDPLLPRLLLAYQAQDIVLNGELAKYWEPKIRFVSRCLRGHYTLPPGLLMAASYQRFESDAVHYWLPSLNDYFGTSLYLDHQSLTPGVDWEPQLRWIFGNSAHVLAYFHSQGAPKSQYVLEELGSFRETGRPGVTVRLDQDSPPIPPEAPSHCIQLGPHATKFEFLDCFASALGGRFTPALGNLAPLTPYYAPPVRRLGVLASPADFGVAREVRDMLLYFGLDVEWTECALPKRRSEEGACLLVWSRRASRDAAFLAQTALLDNRSIGWRPMDPIRTIPLVLDMENLPARLSHLHAVYAAEHHNLPNACRMLAMRVGGLDPFECPSAPVGTSCLEWMPRVERERLRAILMPERRATVEALLGIARDWEGAFASSVYSRRIVPYAEGLGEFARVAAETYIGLDEARARDFVHAVRCDGYARRIERSFVLECCDLQKRLLDD